MILRTIFLLLTAVLLVACGLENVDVTVSEGKPKDAGQQAEVTAINTPSSTNPAPTIAAVDNDEELTETEPTPSKPTNTSMPKVNSFTENDEPVWGDALCPTTMPLCVRPFALEPQGDEQVLQLEMWGTGDRFAAGNENLSFNWRAFDEEDKGYTGTNCGRSTKQAAYYQAGFGHLSYLCFQMDTRPVRLEAQINGAGASFKLLMPVAPDNQTAVGGYSYAHSAQPLPFAEPFIVGPATITIHELIDNTDHLALEITVQAPSDEAVLIDAPDWIVVGSVISFYIVDEMGFRVGWDEAKINAYETIGGEIAAGETQTGFVILEKGGADTVLLVNYGPSSARDTDAATFSLPDLQTNSEGVTTAITIEQQTTSTVEALSPTDAVAPPTATTSTNAPEVAFTRPLDDEWYVDSDGNAIPDFIEAETGFDPLIDDCAPDMCTAEIVGTKSTAIQGENVLVILDASGSMAEDMGGQTRMQTAKNVLNNYATTLPSTASLGFMVYGHLGDNSEAGKPASCAGVELLAPIGQVSEETLPDLLDSFSPNGWTPIADSLAAAETAFAEMESGLNRVILVTDGLETCGGDPVAIAAQLHLNPDIHLIVDVVGFSIFDEGERNALQRIATAGGGEYIAVNSFADFNSYIADVVARERARLDYALCIGQQTLETNVCNAQLLLGANTTINQHILNLSATIASDNEAEIEALKELQRAIDIADQRRYQQYQQWREEAVRLQEELETFDDVYEQYFGTP